MGDEEDSGQTSRVAWVALGACVGVIATLPLALIGGLFLSLFAGGTSDSSLGGLDLGRQAALGLPYGVVLGLGVLAVGAGVGALVGRALADRPRVPKQPS